jgi:hypothetical protein
MKALYVGNKISYKLPINKISYKLPEAKYKELRFRAP